MAEMGKSHIPSKILRWEEILTVKEVCAYEA